MNHSKTKITGKVKNSPRNEHVGNDALTRNWSKAHSQIHFIIMAVT